MRWNFPQRAEVWPCWMGTTPISHGSGRTIEKIPLSFLRISPLYRKNLALRTRSSSGLALARTAGTRIAISAAIGVQVSSGAHLIGFPSISAMQCDAHEYCVIGDARRKSFFFARIRANNLIEAPTLFSESELKPKLNAVEMAMPVFTSDSLPRFERAVVCFPSALVLARLAREPQRSFSLPPLEPIYLREPHITMPK